MKPSEVLELHRSFIRETVLKHHAENPRIFGSVCQGTDTELSDLDLLVDPLPHTSLFDLGAIQIELEERLGITIDLLTPRELPLAFRQHVLQGALPV